MTKHEFMFRLEKALSGLSENEKNEALRYSDDYLSDCGSDNLADVLSQLGSPEKLAEEIKNDIDDASSADTEEAKAAAREDGEQVYRGESDIIRKLPPFNSANIQLLNSKGVIERGSDYSFTWTSGSTSSILKVKVANSTLYVEEKVSTGRFWNFSFGSVKGNTFRLTLPEKDFDAINFHCVNGSMSIYDLNVDNLSVSNINGSISVHDTIAAQLSMKTVNGSVTADPITCGKATGSTVNGSMRLSGSFDGDTDLSTVNGSINLTTNRRLSSYNISARSLGSIRINDERVRNDNSSIGRSVYTANNNASRTITAHANNGSIRLNTSAD